jgi:Zn-dependent peptidase ImmA (M78 family)
LPHDLIATTLAEQEFCTFIFGEDLGETAEGSKFLGYYSSKRKVISIDRALWVGTPKFLFTFAHELGHFYLHNKVDPAKIITGGAQEIRDTSLDIVTNIVDRDRPRSIMEWQANRFASALLVHRSTVLSALTQAQATLGITRRGFIWVDHQRQNQHDCRVLLERLASLYRVSRSVIRYRLRELGLLKEDHRTQVQRIGESLSDVLHELYNQS